MSTLLAEPPIERSNPLSVNPDRKFEVVDGEEVELPPMSFKSNLIKSELSRRLGNFGIEANLGFTACETKIKFPPPSGNQRIPDVIFVPYSRWPKNKLASNQAAGNVLPSICIEVISPTDKSAEDHKKIKEYLQAGVDQVWVVYPDSQEILIHRHSSNILTLTREDTLEGGDVLPGFRLPLVELFPVPEPALDSAES